MKAEWKRAWVNALRSGRYRQCRGFLHDEDRFCALGVLCDLGPNGRWEGGYFESPFVKSTGGTFPYEIRFVCNLPNDQVWTIEIMNDDEKFSFTEIADWIEQHVQDD